MKVLCGVLTLLAILTGAPHATAASQHHRSPHRATHTSRTHVRFHRQHRYHVIHLKRFSRPRPTESIPRTAPETTPTRTAGIVTVPTAAGIKITVASNLVNQFQGFIQDLMDLGYKPRSIGCFATSGHVKNSNHYHGGACDFDQTGRNQTASQMYHVGDLARKWGLRDGCSFHDCGHIDDGRNVGWINPGGLIQKYITRALTPQTNEKPKVLLEQFEE